jgi:4'-phosphopantetheinyl transferase
VWNRGTVEPGPPAGVVHVWAIGLDFDPEDLHALSRCLSGDEHERAARRLHEKHRSRFVAGRAALRHLLAGYAATPAEDLRFCYGPGGKPELLGVGPLRFNLSHSDAVAVCAVARCRPIGVDVERIHTTRDVMRVAERFFDEHESSRLRALAPAEQREEFFRCWTRREAYQKARGESVFGLPRSFDLEPGSAAARVRADGARAGWGLRDLEPSEGYIGAVVAQGDDWELVCRRWIPEPDPG